MWEASKNISVPRSMENIHKVFESLRIYVNNNTAFDSSDKKIKFIDELKILVYELFSNAVNHSIGEMVNIAFRIVNNNLQMKIETVGGGFKIKPVSQDNVNFREGLIPPYPPDSVGNEYTIYKDDDFKVFCLVLNEFKLKFFCRKHPHTKSGIKDINEHYGLFLICMLCDVAEYRRNSAGSDIFFVSKFIN